jgi:hypothetical protein
MGGLFACVKHGVGINSLANTQKKNILKKIPSPTWEVDVDMERVKTSASIVNQIETIFNSNLKSQEYFKKFLSNPSWWNLGNTKGKTFERTTNDWMGSAVKAAARVIQNNADRLPGIISVVANNSEIRLALKELITQQAKVTRAMNAIAERNTGARNVIYYGAPGTGKSYRIRNDTKSTNPNLVVTTVFHADTQGSDFIGSFRPTVADNKLGYQFQPGPFTNAFVSAVNNPAEMHYLIIEEINRAPAASVFGELFQLLDRNSDGSSEYSINPADAAHGAYLATMIKSWNGIIALPSNLSIFASMNSSDQAVMPLDTAFKRRWEFIYIPVCFDSCTQGSFQILDENNNYQDVSWKKLASAINHALAGLNISEDRFLGPYFLTAEEIAPLSSDNNEGAKAALCGKLFMYLWDDVLRHGNRDEIFAKEVRTYGELVKYYTTGKQIFNNVIMEQLFAESIEIDSNES